MKVYLFPRSNYDINELNKMSSVELGTLALTASDVGVCDVSEFQEAFNEHNGESDSVTALFLALYGDKFVFFED